MRDISVPILHNFVTHLGACSACLSTPSNIRQHTKKLGYRVRIHNTAQECCFLSFLRNVSFARKLGFAKHSQEELYLILSTKIKGKKSYLTILRTFERPHLSKIIQYSRNGGCLLTKFT
jgi:hypothetical protein